MDGDLNRETLRTARRIVVIGGGISGLAAAHRLIQHIPGSAIAVLEADDRLGGKIATEQVDGFTIESGPDSFLAAKPRGVGLSDELGLGARLRPVTPRARRAFVLAGGALQELPEGLSGLVPTRLAPLARSPLLSPAGKARVALDFVLPARRSDADESLGGFIRRRLGNEAWERLVEPLMAGIYAADGDRLSLAATFPQLRTAERDHGGLIRGMLAARRISASGGDPPAPGFLTPAGGMSELVSALEQRLVDAGVAIQTGAIATVMTPRQSGYDIRFQSGDTIAATAVILATPAFASATLLDSIDPVLAADLRGIPYASTALVSLAYRREDIPHPLDAHGYVVPRATGGPILACTWSSRKWAGRAPDGWELLRVFVGRAGEEEVLSENDQTLLAVARHELATRLGITAAPGLIRIARWPSGMPQYVLGHPARIARVEAALSRQPGLFLAGNAYHGVGIPDCTASGELAADAAIAFEASVASKGASPAMQAIAAWP